MLKWVFGAIALLVIGGFGFIALTDVPVTQTEISKTLSNDQFYQ